MNNNNNVTYFDNFGVEHIPKEVGNFIGNKNIIRNIFKIQAYDSVMCGYFCNGFTDFKEKNKKKKTRKQKINRFCQSFFTKLFFKNFKKWWYNFKPF